MKFHAYSYGNVYIIPIPNTPLNSTLHGGTTSVKSKESYGTEFSIRIPCKLADENYKDIACCDAIDNSCIEKINIEFLNIYN
ncbi:hypothetical protein CPJCM30710_27570 [Clostridium polyendosporum]|uniref:Uncharacterized protein n=1 Tax=Clostridium polyendosporum TaxID=69208 RepID=A0A919VHU5_9CLOT|nr:HAMP domain-containing histidine kinase [Clostridium polyendosporum]GIM30091.1 hypothetical protein CPJCM30710_27570 [Clostridium polyendosporum]